MKCHLNKTHATKSCHHFFVFFLFLVVFVVPKNVISLCTPCGSAAGNWDTRNAWRISSTVHLCFYVTTTSKQHLQADLKGIRFCEWMCWCIMAPLTPVLREVTLFFQIPSLYSRGRYLDKHVKVLRLLHFVAIKTHSWYTFHAYSREFKRTVTPWHSHQNYAIVMRGWGQELACGHMTAIMKTINTRTIILKTFSQVHLHLLSCTLFLEWKKCALLEDHFVLIVIGRQK